jgi:hypothetical protein
MPIYYIVGRRKLKEIDMEFNVRHIKDADDDESTA